MTGTVRAYDWHGAYADVPLSSDDSLTIRATWRGGPYVELDTGLAGAFDVIDAAGMARTPEALAEALRAWLAGMTREGLIGMLELANDPTAERLRD